MSLKLRITAWFSVMILALTALVVTIVFVVADESLADDPIDELIKTVGMNASSLSRDEKKHKFDEFKPYHNGVYCQLFDSEGNVLQGGVPENIIYREAFDNGVITTHKADTGEYYIYDMKVGSSFWIRGYISTDEPSETTKLIIVSTVITLPLILVLSIVGGWIITKRSLRTIDTVITTVDSINNGDDLSKRLNLQKGPSEIRKLSNEFDRMFGRLEKSFDAEKQFASDVSHELRTPITVALAECHSLKKDTKSEECLASISVIEKQCIRISELIDSLLSITRLQQNTDHFPTKLFDISDFLEICCEDYASEHRILTQENEDEKSLVIKIEKGVFVNYNPDLMSRVMFNLLENARKYTKDNGNIWVYLKSSDKGAVITVGDNGIGISKEDLPKIWNRFWQADKSRSLDKGVGLGLAMVKEMVEYQHGNINVESQIGKGTKFTIELFK